MGVVVHGLSDPEVELTFGASTGPREAVIAAHARSVGDGNTWDHERRHGHLVEEGRWHFFCGDFAARKEPP